MYSTMADAITNASAKSRQFHSLIIGKDSKWYNTWDDWYLIPSSRPLVNPPVPKTKFVDVPGRDGVIDLSELINPYTVYGNRGGSIEFHVLNRNMDSFYNELTAKQQKDFSWSWYNAYSTIMSLIQGRSGLKFILLDDLNFYYEGRISVNSWKSSENWSSITLDYNVQPWKKRMNTSLDPWKWDPFNFETGIIRYVNQQQVTTGGTTITIVGDAIRETPWFTATTAMTVKFKNKTYNLKAGKRMQIPDIVIVEGENKLTFTGTGKVSVEYRGGSL